MAEEYKRAGWYPDPDGVPGERWWNGSGWSDSRRGGVAQAAPSSAAPAWVAPAPQRTDPYAPASPALSQVPGRRIPTSIDASANRNAMIGFVTGLISLFFNVFLVLAPIAIVFSILGLRRANELRAQGAPTNLRAFALIGLASGIIAAVIGAISVIAIVVPFIQFSSVR